MQRYLLYAIIMEWLVFSAISWSATYSGGNGTITQPYRIASVDDWQTFMTATSDWNRCFILMDDIDLQDITLTPVGNAAIQFTGFFNGNHHIIRNAAINTPSADYVGLFGHNTGRISDLGLESVTMTGIQYVGGLLGINARRGTSSGTVTGCYSTGTVSGGAESKYVGGLIGANAGTVSHCCSTCTVSNGSNSDVTGGLVGSNGGGTITACCSTGPVSGYMGVGGLAGVNAPVTIWTYQGQIIYPAAVTDSYSSGQVSGFRFVGGFTGNNSGAIKNCYSAGRVIGSFYTGGLVGDSPSGLFGTGSVVDSFWDTQTSGQTISAGGEGKKTAQMQMRTTFTNAGWDFSADDGTAAIWMMLRPGEDYPRLAWQDIYAGDIAGLYGVDLADYAELAQHWMNTDCPSNCEDADIDSSGTVDSGDLSLLATHWLEGN
ncbi:MAG: hypothetical protein ABFD91_07725 [Anaerohalosphaeraceae bacterium]